MSDNFDAFSSHYRVLATDDAAREEALTDPKESLRSHFGYAAREDYRLEVIPEDLDTLTLFIPVLDEGADPQQRAEETGGRIFDLLVAESGVGGYLIPNPDLTWVLRDIRAHVVKESGRTLDF